MAVTPCNFLHIEAVTSVGNSNGIHFGVSSGSTNDVEILNCVLSSSSNAGLRVASAMSSATALRVTGGEMKLNNVHGFGFNSSILATCFGDDFTIDGTVFADNGSIIAGNGTGHVSLLGFNGSALAEGPDDVGHRVRSRSRSAAIRRARRWGPWRSKTSRCPAPPRVRRFTSRSTRAWRTCRSRA